jgi:hypothetical protein
LSRETDAAVAKAIGWELMPVGFCSPGEAWGIMLPDGCFSLKAIVGAWSPSTSDADALAALSQLAAEHPMWYVGIHRHVGADVWDCEVGTAWACEHTIASAICAAILALKQEA